MKRLFEAGRVVATPGALDAMMQTGTAPFSLIERHLTGDYGSVDAEDAGENKWSMENSARVFSAYDLNDGSKLWVITEADRSVTTILKPSEY
jgi:hypothetical protein